MTGSPRRIDEVAALVGVPLAPTVAHILLRHLQLVLIWNAKINLTGPADLDALIDRHLADSLCVLVACDLPSGGRVADVGSGAGFPGVPIATLRPDLHVTLVEATRRKVAFLEYVRDELRLENLRVVWGRAEHLARQPGFRESFDVVVTRAVAPMAVAVAFCLPLCVVGGVAVFVKGPAVHTELAGMVERIERWGGAVESSRTFVLPPGDRRTVVVVVRKQTSQAAPGVLGDAVHRRPLPRRSDDI